MLDLVGADLALVGAAERHRDRGADLDAFRLGRLDHRPEALDALGDRAVDVRRLKASLAAPKTTISSGDCSRGAESAASSPFMFGTSTE